MYWSCKRTKSRNAIFNFIVGNRGAGKTFGFIDYAIDRFVKGLRRGEVNQFIYARRTVEELKPLCITRPGSLFDKVAQVKWPAHMFRADSGKLWIDGELAGYGVAVSQMPKLKSVDYKDVKLFALDEFIIDTGVGQHYIRGEEEPQILLDFYQTVDRDEDRLTMFFLANSITENNPYFNYFDVRMPAPGKIRLYGDDQEVLVENVVDPELVAKKEGTRFGRFVKGTKYGDYSIGNQMLRDSKAFVARKTVTSAYKFTMLYLDHKIGVWYDMRNGRYYLSMDVLPDSPFVFAVTTEDHRPNIMLMHGAKKSPFVANLLKAYDLGCVYYESAKLASWFQEIVRMI